MSDNYDTIIIGAGVAGLAAAQALRAAGQNPLVLEARDRIGGRVWSDRSRTLVELGAEFVHGERAVTWRTIQAAGLHTITWTGERLFAHNGCILPPGDRLPAQVYTLYEQLSSYTGEQDLSAFDLAHRLAGSDNPALGYALRWLANIEGADLARLSVRELSRERSLSSAGWHNFHIAEGYDQVPAFLARGVAILLNTPVSRIEWDEQGAILAVPGRSLHTRRVIVTVPVSLLREGRPAFIPELPTAKRQALERIAMGHVTKLALWFDQICWDDFMACSTNGTVPTWWPAGSGTDPALMGYAGGAPALELAAMGERAAIACALDELCALFGQGLRSHFVAGRLVDWSRDQWSLGAYTYSSLGIGDARADLAAPVGTTLFFAGEATCTNGHLATVHGAIESGERVAQELLAEV